MTTTSTMELPIKLFSLGAKIGVGTVMFRANMANLNARVRLRTPEDKTGDAVAIAKSALYGYCWWYSVPLMVFDEYMDNKPWRHFCPDYFTHHLLYDDMQAKGQLTIPNAMTLFKIK